jgi:hypothetical protein
LVGGGRGTEERRPCSGGEGHRRRGPRGGEVPGAHGGSIGLLVDGRDGRKRGSPWEPEAVAEESMVKDLHMSFSESIGNTSYRIGTTCGDNDEGGGGKCRRASGSRCGARGDRLSGCSASRGRKEAS